MKQYFKCAGFYTGFILVCFIVAGGGNVLADPSVDIVDIDWKSPIALEHPLVGKIYDSKGELTPDKLGDHLAASRYVLIGEKHDNIDHHQLELRLLQLLLGQKKNREAGPAVSIAMEMLNSGQQPSIDTISEEFRLSDDLQVASAELKERLDWPEHGWPWGDYAAVISWVLEQRLPLYAANLNRETMHSLYKSGLDDRFQSARQLKEVLHDSLLDQVFDGHCGLMPRDKLGSMLDIQLAKDSAMANALLAAETPQSVLIAGSGHIRKDTAVPRHLQQADSVITVALIEVDSEKTNVADYDLFERFDVAVFTPVANQRDYCAELEKSMKKH